MESKKINQLATELAPDLSDLTIIGDPTTGISKKITLSQMASLFTGTVEEYANLAAFPLVGVADTIYIALDTNILYRWNTGTSAYVELSPNIVSSLVFNDANGFDGTINLVGSVATLTITTALTTGSVGFIGASGALLQDNANFFWDDTNNRLGLGTNAPTTALDVFGSGIIGRINGTSTNNAYLGFASAGTNKWSVGNVQSDHRFRIFSEANSAELISVLQTGEFGIGIANPLTKLHIDGGATALIANLDADVSVAKSVSFRSDNSNRINLEVSGTESGSDAGANFFIRRYSDAGALIDTPLTITRSTGAISLATALSGTSASFSSTATASAFIPSGATIPTNGMYLSAANTLDFATNSTNKLTLTSTGILGLGITPSAWYTGYIAMQLGASASIFGNKTTADTNTTQLANNAYLNTAATNWQYINTDEATRYEQVNGEHNFYSVVSGSAGGNITWGTSKMTITSAGNVGIGVTTPSSLLHIFGAGSGNNVTYTKYTCGDGGDIRVGKDSGVNNNAMFGTWSNNDVLFYGNQTERMRITSGGYIVTSSVTYGNTTGAAANMYLFGVGDYGIGRSVSSIRYKTQVEDVEKNYVDNIYKMRPIWYRSLCDRDRKDWSHFGFIAEEMAEIEPRFVHWNKDEDGNDYAEGVQYDRITALLVAALQEQNQTIQELKAEIDILKAK